MSKRLNPHRRLLARQMALRRAMVKDGNAADRGKLQEGRVRSHVENIYMIQVTTRADWESKGKRQRKPHKPFALK